jgi:uncharacterized protein (TIGR03663 family)
MVKNGFYKYDPTNYHGPLHFYVLFLSQTLFGRNLWALRMPVVIMSTLCVWLTLKFEPLVGRTVARWAAVAMAISPGFVFYGRYSIHEVWMVSFSMLFILGALGLWRFGTRGYLWCAVMGVAGMILTKETYVIHLGCALIAAVFCYVSHRLTPTEDATRARQRWDIVDLAMAVFTGTAMIVFFYSGTFFHWNGLKGLYEAYSAWFATGTQGHGHEKPPDYWLRLIGRYELPVAIGLVTCILCQQLKNISLRYLAIYGLGTLIAYSIVKYKTPWCIVSIVWPFLFLFGAALKLAPLRLRRLEGQWLIAVLLVAAGLAGWFAKSKGYEFLWPFVLIVACAALLVAARQVRTLPFLLRGALVVSLGWCIWLNFFRCTTDTEPYVYVQTYNEVFKLTKPVLSLAHRNPTYYQMTGHIIRDSSYPLPWILGDFPRVGYYEHETLPATLDGDFLLVKSDRIKEIEGKLHNSYYTEPLTIRPYQDTSKVYFDAKRFKDFFPGRAPDFTGGGGSG